ncbi:MAG: hypothetical protein L5656_05400 [Thermanaeromonas sp.]|uniref:hypothetical protein n=1 Tax=Thermanaeromonas sp. TaxID=2003697 RepID=UPI0024377FA8|nr:hypothetical protein [Thermanaeromonas sp.]MCG0277948.1 hypothetical protein [Thermanaeromonas sp.]
MPGKVESRRINIDLDRELWRQAGMVAAKLEITKRKLVEMALKEFISRSQG